MTVAKILSERQETHGDFKEVARVAQTFRELMRDTVGWEEMNDTQKEALDSMASKFGRLGSGSNPHFRDHWDDLAGYATLASMHCDSDTDTVVRDIATAVEQIKVGGDPTGVDDDGERFPNLVSKLRLDPANMPQVSKKKGFFSKRIKNDDDEDISLEKELEDAYHRQMDKDD